MEGNPAQGMVGKDGPFQFAGSLPHIEVILWSSLSLGAGKVVPYGKADVFRQATAVEAVAGAAAALAQSHDGVGNARHLPSRVVPQAQAPPGRALLLIARPLLGLDSAAGFA